MAKKDVFMIMRATRRERELMHQLAKHFGVSFSSLVRSLVFSLARAEGLLEREDKQQVLHNGGGDNDD